MKGGEEGRYLGDPWRSNTVIFRTERTKEIIPLALHQVIRSKMITRSKITAICLAFIVCLCLPKVSEACAVSTTNFDKSNSDIPAESYSQIKEGPGPRKKTKKGRRTILDKKSKMKSGKRCPSF